MHKLAEVRQKRFTMCVSEETQRLWADMVLGNSPS